MFSFRRSKLRSHITRFLRKRNAGIKRIVESPSGEWHEYLHNTSSRS
jgi:hypothetical protein